MKTEQTAVPKRKGLGLGHKIAPYAFISPYFLIFFSFAVFPILFSIYVSTTDWTGFNQYSSVGLSNYITLLSDSRFYKALGNTLLFMCMIIPVQIILGLIIALMLSSRILPLKKTFRLLNFLPYLTASVALGLIFSIMFDPNFGSINWILRDIGIANPPNWFGSAWPARAMIAMITVWRYAGYTAVLFLAGITNINPDLYEASEIDGANAFQRATKIILPLLKPVMVFVILTTLIGCFQIFEEPFMIFQVVGKMTGGPQNAALTGTWLFYDTSFGSTMRFGYGSAIAFALLICIAILTFFINKMLNLGGDKD